MKISPTSSAPSRTEQSSSSERPQRGEQSTRGQTSSASSERRQNREEQAQQIREEVTHEEIARRAHELWEQDGCRDGRDQEHWMEAEKQLRGSSFRKTAEAVTGDGDAHAQARAIKASAERRENAQTRKSDF